VIAPEDLDAPTPGANECLLCGAEIWSCLCDPRTPFKKPAAAELERARAARLTKAERR
jgi:hypothetical protein